MTETVFSHPSKLELIDEARTKGFTVIVMHVGVETPDLSVARVGTRVEEGGQYRTRRQDPRPLRAWRAIHSGRSP
nr:hypothetical protein [Altericroceibacterium spongiae]